MNFFSLEGSGFFIAISVSLLLIGAVVYYFNTRVAALEKALVRQNQVLADFIQNVRNSHAEGKNMQTDCSIQDAGNGATVEAINAARTYFSNEMPQDKVDVSDDESDDEDSSIDTSELESDFESNKEDDPKIVTLNNNIKVEDLNIIQNNVTDMTANVSSKELNTAIKPSVVELLQDGFNKEAFSKNLSSDELKENTVEEYKRVIKLSEVDDLDAVSSSLGSTLGEDDEDDDGVTIDSKEDNVITDFSKLKVAKLKELATNKGIKNAQKLKKAALVALLEGKK